MKIAIKFSSQGNYQSHCTDFGITDLKQVVPSNEGFEFYEISKEQLTNIRYLKLAAGEITIDESAKQADIAKFEIAKKIRVLKTELNKIKEDIEQETFGLIRDDYEEKKTRAANIVNELRELEGKEPREKQTEIL